MAGARLSDMKSALIGGGTRSNQFRVELTFPTFVTLGALSGQRAQFLCNAAQLPSSNITNIEVPYRGRILNVAGEKVFEPWNISIISDTTFGIRNALEQWSNGIQNNTNSGGLTNPSQYQVDLVVHQLDREGATLKEYKFVDAYPTTIGSIQLSYDAMNQIQQFDVVFQYNYWTSLTADGGASNSPSASGSVSIPGVGSFPIPTGG